MSLRVVFMGTPDFAQTCLDTLVKSHHQVVGVVTAIDKPAGRGKQIRTSAVKKGALSLGLPLLQPERLKDKKFIEALQQWNADVFVVVAFRMIPKEVWTLPKRGTFNLHASLLPNYRGAAPINWALIDGQKTTGVTTFFIDDKIDTGAILLQKEIEVAPDETAGSLHDKLAPTGANLVVETLDALVSGIRPQPQLLQGNEKAAPKLNKTNTKINWEKPAQEIVNHIHGLSPYPGAWTTIEDEHNNSFVLKVFSAKVELATHSVSKGTIVVLNKQLKVAVTDGFVCCQEIQLPNKRRMNAKDALNGFSFSLSAQAR